MQKSWLIGKGKRINVDENVDLIVGEEAGRISIDWKEEKELDGSYKENENKIIESKIKLLEC